MDQNGEEALAVLTQARQRFSQKRLAELLEVAPRTVSRWEQGDVLLNGVKLLALRYLVQQPDAIVPSIRIPDNTPEDGAFTFIDLFAGIGGTRLGFEAEGGRCVFTSEWNTQSQKTYLANFPSEHPIAGDIREIEADAIPDHDLLVAGFPCQPFSIAGVSKKNALGDPHGFECKTQGTLFFELARVIRQKRPAAFVLENVKNLERHDKGQTFAVIMETLREELGYHVQHRVVDAKPFVPQHRERIFIVGFRDKCDFNWSELSLPPMDNAPRLGAILHPENGTQPAEEPYTIGPKAKINPKYTLTDHLWKYLQDYAAKHRAKGNGFGFGLVGPKDVARTLSARYYKDGSEILIDQGKSKSPRRLTPRECARLMGFPDSYRITVSDTQAYKQFGNSVCVPVVREVAKLIKPVLLKQILRRNGKSKHS